MIIMLNHLLCLPIEYMLTIVYYISCYSNVVFLGQFGEYAYSRNICIVFKAQPSQIVCCQTSENGTLSRFYILWWKLSILSQEITLAALICQSMFLTGIVENYILNITLGTDAYIMTCSKIRKVRMLTYFHYHITGDCFGWFLYFKAHINWDKYLLLDKNELW